MTIVLLGPQPRDYTDVSAVVDELDVDGQVGLITAGWQENESDDGALREALGRPTLNLRLHARSDEVAEEETEFVAAWTVRQKHLRRLQEFYRLRLDGIDDAAGAISVRHAEPELLEEQIEISVSQLRHLDEDHLRRCAEIRARFDEKWQAPALPSLMAQREAVAEELQDCTALVIAGGHVVALLNRLRLFDVFSALGDRPIIAWSAGAMVLTDRIVLFHDYPPFGKNLAQVLDQAYGFCPGLVALPDISARVRLDNGEAIGRFARRMAPAHCLGLDPGCRIRFEKGEMIEAKDTLRLAANGELQRGWSL